jgi:hypothetical protein
LAEGVCGRGAGVVAHANWHHFETFEAILFQNKYLFLIHF